MKNKRANAQSIENATSAGRDIAILTAEEGEIEKYLKQMDFKEHIPDEESRHIYEMFKSTFYESIPERTRGNMIFVALIERIARTGMILDKMEKTLIKMPFPATQVNRSSARSDYTGLQTEHRRCIETFANLRYAEKRTRGSKVLDELRKTVYDKK